MAERIDPVDADGPGPQEDTGAGAGRHARGSQDSTDGWFRLLREAALVVVVALVLSVFIRTFLVQAFYVPSESMEDTLLPSDRILASKITTRIGGVHRGDVVVFADPGGWLPPAPTDSGFGGAVKSAFEWIGILPSSSGQDLVKRAIGVAGDHVICCDVQGGIQVNGVSLDESAYLYPGNGTDQVRFDVLVPASSLFVMGDNRGNSRDSRYHLEVNSGAVPVDNVVGRAVVTVWPLSRWATLPVPEIFGNPQLDSGR